MNYKEIIFDDWIKYLSEDIAQNVLLSKNYNKVKYESISSIVLQEYFYSYNKDIQISFEFKGEKNSNNIYRRELLPLNFLKIQNNYIYIVNLKNENPKEVYITYYYLNFDFILPVFIDYKRFKIKFFGYIDYESFTRKRRVALDYYQIKIEEFLPFEDLIKYINLNKTFEQEIEYEKNKYIVNLYKSYFDNKNIPEDFINLVEYLPSDIYKELLYSEELAFYYLNLQKLFYKEEVLENKEIRLKENLFEKFSNNINKFIEKILSINHFNISSKYALASTEQELKATIFEYNIPENKIIKIDNKSDVYINTDKNTLTISELDNYIGKMWLLFIAQDDNIFNIIGKIEDIFLNWSEKFFEENKEKFDYLSIHLNSKNKKDVVDETGALDIKIDNLSLKSDCKIFLALLIY